MPVLSPAYNLLSLYPDVAKQWHPTKNEGTKPQDFTPGSGKKAWWLCPEGHDWEATIANRTSGQGCPECKRIFKAQRLGQEYCPPPDYALESLCAARYRSRKYYASHKDTILARRKNKGGNP